MGTKMQKTISFGFNSEDDIRSYPVSLSDGDFSYRVDEMVAILTRVRKYSLRELRGHFTFAEAGLISAAAEGLLYAGEMSAKTVLLCSVVDGIDFDGLAEKWNVDSSALEEKIRKLTEFQCYVVISMAHQYWSAEKKDVEALRDIFMVGGKVEE